MALIAYAPETADIFTIVGPNGSQAVLNDPTSPFYVGSVSDISGFDSPEVQEGRADAVERDGAVQGNNWYGGRPFSIQGEIAAASRVERNQRWARLSTATDAMRNDGTLTWTPAGGEEVFVKFRRQQPPRLAGGWVKTYFFGGYSDDAPIYSTALRSYFYNRNLENLTATAGASATTTVTSIAVTFPRAGTYTIKVPINFNATWNGGNVTIGVSNLTGATVANATLANGAVTGSWQTATVDVTVAPGDLVGNITVTSASVAGSGKIALIQMPQIVGPDAPVIADTWTQATNYTNTYAAGVSYGPDPNGGADTPPVVRLYGPGTNPTIACQYNGGTLYTIPFTADGGLTLTAGQYIDVDFATHRVVRDNGTSLYRKVAFAGAVWFPLQPVATQSATSQPIWVSWASGSTTASVMRVQYRNAWMG